MNNREIILVGGGGHCHSVIDVAECAGYSIVGIIDVKENVGKKILGYPVIGTDDQIPLFVGKAQFLVTVGQIKNVDLRLRLHNELIAAGGELATVVSPRACVSPHAHIGAGSVVMHFAVVNANSRIGRGCIINTCANVEHDVEIGDYSHISTGALVNGNCMVGCETFVGSGAVLVNGINIGPGILIAAGAVVCESIEKKGMYAGNPARLKYEME